ncbi:uncharacterized protein LOC121407471 isoform X2 [Lytechinus variegatus]|uniref:uncharacterized protein LOC121407471 isoform X2 n=1 Tax=Lytechinus variegatus TaxID=7654 RepID=UPI001BB166E7|nr:uncharacterized protein LOC121407471 isoform X2 [Lytechinus variegatus]
MSVAGEKEKNPESASSQSVTDVSSIPIEDEDRKGKYELYEMPGSTVYRICLLGDMFESLFALAGFVAVVTGMLWALHYATSSSSREGSDEDELGTDIDNPEGSPAKKVGRHQTNSSEGPGDSEVSPTTENSTSSQPRPETTNQAERGKRSVIESDGESTQSSVDDFADAMDTVEHQVENPSSDRLNGGPGDGSRDINMEEDEKHQDQDRELMDQAIDDAFLILDDDGSEMLNGEAKKREYADQAIEDMNLPEDASASSGVDSNSDFVLDEALEDAYAKLDMQDQDKPSLDYEEDIIDKTESPPQVLVSDEVNLSLTKPEELTPESPAVPESKDDSQETLDQPEAVESVDKDITTVQTSVEYIVVESNDVPNAPVVKNAIDDDVVEDGSDDTTTSSDADTVKDAGGDIKARENELDKDEMTKVLNVVADLISDEMVKEIMGDIYSEGKHDSSNENQQEIANVVADAIANDMVNDAERNIAVAEQKLDSNERTDVVNVVSDVIANDMINDTERRSEGSEPNLSKDEETDVLNVVADAIANDMVIDNEKDSITLKETEVLNVVSDRISNEMIDEIPEDGTVQHEDNVEDINDLVQPVDTRDVECVLRYSEDFESKGPDEENYDNNGVSVVNVVAESLASEMVQEILDETVIKSGWCEAADDNELYQTSDDENGEENQLLFDRRVSDVQIPQIRIESVDDDEPVVEVNIGEEFTSPQWGDENEYTSALPVEDDHNVPNDSDFAKEDYVPSDYIPDSDENQDQTMAETQSSEEMDVTVSVGEDGDHDFQMRLESDTKDNTVSDVQMVVTVKASNGDPSEVRDLLTKLTGENVQSTDVSEGSVVDIDPKHGVVDIMNTIARDSIDDHSENREGTMVDENRQRVDEELIPSAAARPVECSSIDLFCSHPQEPRDEFRQTGHQDSPAILSGDESNLDSLERDPVMDGDIAQPHMNGDSVVVTAQVSVPKTNINSLMSSIVGNDYTEEREENPVDPTMEEFSLADVKSVLLPDTEDSQKLYYDGEPICEEGVVAAPVSMDEQKDLDPFSKFFCTKIEDDEELSPTCDIRDDIKSLDKDDKVVLSSLPAEGGSDLAKARQTACEDDLVPTDVRKTINGHVNLKSLLRSLSSELSVNVDLDDSDISEASPPRKRVITDEMVREAIQYLLQKPFLYSYGMYDSNDSLFYNAILDDTTGSRSFALISSLVGKELTPEKKSTLFALISSKENLNDDDEEEIDEPIFPDIQDEEESQINFDELFASLDRRPDQQDDRAVNPAEQEVEEGLIADASGGMEESVPVSSGRGFDGYPEVEDAIPERLIPDSISPSDDDSSSVSSSDTSGTYILDNQMGLVEEDEDEDQERSDFKEPSYPSEMSRYPTNQSRELPGYNGYYPRQTGVEEEPEEEHEEEEEKPQASRMFFITSAMLAQMNEEQNNESSSDNDYERRSRQSESPETSSSEDYLQEIPAGYGPNSGRNWPENSGKKHQYLPEDDPTRSYPSEVPTAEYDYDDEIRFRPISGGESSSEPTPRYPTSHVPKDNQKIQHPSQNGHHVFSDYDSSSELLEIEKQRQILFPSSSPQNNNHPSQTTEDLQNGDEDMDYLPPRLVPAVEPMVTKNLNYQDKTAPACIADLLENGKQGPVNFKPITETTITKDMNVPEQLQPLLTRPVFNQDLQESGPHAESHEPSENYATCDPGHLEPNAVSEGYAKTNGHTEPFRQSEDSMLSHSDHRGYSGSSEDGEFDYDDDTSFASGERMFALIGLPSNSPPAALSVTASIEVFRAEEHMETQKSLYSYEISKGVAGPDGKMVKLQEQSFSFERHSEYVVQSTNNSYDMVISESVSDSAGEQFSYLVQADNHLQEPNEQIFDADRRSENDEDSADSPAEGFSMNETVTADFVGDQFAQPGTGTDYPQEELKLDLPFDSSGEELSEREGLQRQVESLSELLSERTLDMQRFKDDYPFLDRIMTDPNSSVPGYEEGQLIGLLETYRQLEEDVLELMNIYKETKAQLAELELMERM